MKTILVTALLLICSSLFLSAQTNVADLPSGTNIPLKLLQKLSSNDAMQAQVVVSEDVKDLKGNKIISAGTPVETTTQKTPSVPGKAGNITVNFKSVNAIDGQKINLTGSFSAEGKKGTNLIQLNGAGVKGKEAEISETSAITNIVTSSAYSKKKLEVIKDETSLTNTSVAKRKTDADKDGLKGKVKNITTNGKYLTKYDENGNKLEENTRQEAIDEGEDVKTTFKYDGKGYLIERNELYLTSKSETKTSLKNDELGRMIEEKSSESNKTTYKYDNNGYLIETAFWVITKGKIQSKYTYKYDIKGNLSEMSEYVDFGKGIKLNSTNFYTYDDKANMIENKLDNASFKQFNTKITYKYDDKNNILEQINYDATGKLTNKISLKYEYDINNNWTKKTTMYKGGTPSTTSRKIEYYN